MNGGRQLGTREAVVAEALSWVGTPYHLGPPVKGVTADCATLLLGVYQACGIIGKENLGVYGADWFHNTNEERYILGCLRHMRKIFEARCTGSLDLLPGNLVATHEAGSKIYNHGAIVIAWPKIIHCISPVTCVVDASRDPYWTWKMIVAFDPWAKIAGEAG